MNALRARIAAALERLEPRERWLVGAAAAVAGLLLVWLLAVAPLVAGARALTRRADTAEQELAALEALRGRYDEVHDRLAAVEARIQSGPRGEIFTTLEDLARQSAVQVASMEPRTAPASDDYRETKVQVALKDVTLAQVVNYLHRIETAPQLLSIKSLRLRTRADKPELLDATFTVSSFEPASS